MEFETEFVEGMQFDRGYISAYFVTDTQRMEAILEDPYILITDKKITAIADILPTLEKLAPEGQQGPAHRRRGRRRRGAGDARREQAARHRQRPRRQGARASATAARRCCATSPSSTGGKVISEELGRKLDSVQLEDLGRARRVVATKDNTTVIEGAAPADEIAARIKQIKAQIEETTSDYDKEKLQERLAKLSGGVAIIKVGAGTETELKEKKHRVEDALSATRAAVEEGIVPGGGVALLNAQSALDKLVLEGDAAIGVQIVRRALEEPIRQLAENAGLDGRSCSRTSAARAERKQQSARLRRHPDEYSDMLERGIVDPAKVTRSAVENAASIGGMVLTTEVMITDKPEPKSAIRRCRPGGMGDF